MNNKEISLKIYNFPFNLSLAQKELNEKFIDELQKLIDKYEFIPNGGIQKVGLILIYNKKIPLKNLQVFKENLYLAIVNYPKSVSTDQDIKNSCFRANLDFLLKRSSFLFKDSIKQLSIITFYNKHIDEIEIKGLTKDESEEKISSFSSSVPKYRMEQVILNQELKSEIKTTLTILKQKNLIYDEWGFNQIDPEPKAIINFYGHPGTGKTMMAHAIASELDCKILSLNYADIESKFVGDAPKNLVLAFETASIEKALLFFDEADSFLGKRILNVSSSSDQAVNSLRSQMLILLDNFDGIVIFATNLITNYDRAFESRIFKHLRFDLPNSENRTEIIRKTIPLKVPFKNKEFLTDEQISTLVEISEGFSGREIKNGVLGALTNAVSNERYFVEFSDFEIAFTKVKKNREELQQEYKKEDPMVLDRKKALEDKIKKHLSETKGEANKLEGNNDKQAITN
jgi:AAA+ superfamily predicted ATPase